MAAGFSFAGCGSERGPPALRTPNHHGLPETTDHPDEHVTALLGTLVRLLASQAAREQMTTASDTVETPASLPSFDDIPEG
jgi:hypothetical protein